MDCLNIMKNFIFVNVNPETRHRVPRYQVTDAAAAAESNSTIGSRVPYTSAAANAPSTTIAPGATPARTCSAITLDDELGPRDALIISTRRPARRRAADGARQ